MKVLLRHWYTLDLIPGALLALWLGFHWDALSWPARLVTLNCLTLFLHEFEEYGWPGGFPAIMNSVINTDSPRPDRYPLNQLNAMIVNVFTIYVVYGLPILFPSVAWLALNPVLFGFSQFGFHGIYANRKLRTLYNPGLAAVVLLHIPIGIAYIWYGEAHGLISGLDWAIGVAYLLIFIICFRLFNFSYMPDANSRYPFTPEELSRFDMTAKLARHKSLRM